MVLRFQNIYYLNKSALCLVRKSLFIISYHGMLKYIHAELLILRIFSVQLQKGYWLKDLWTQYSSASYFSWLPRPDPVPSKGNGKIPTVFNGLWFGLQSHISPYINLIQIRLAVHKLENETPQPLKSALIHWM